MRGKAPGNVRKGGLTAILAAIFAVAVFVLTGCAGTTLADLVGSEYPALTANIEKWTKELDDYDLSSLSDDELDSLGQALGVDKVGDHDVDSSVTKPVLAASVAVVNDINMPVEDDLTFPFTVTLTKSDGTVDTSEHAAVIVNEYGNIKAVTKVTPGVAFDMAPGDKIVILNVGTNTTYSVSETTDGNWTQSVNGSKSGSTGTNVATGVAFTNTAKKATALTLYQSPKVNAKGPWYPYIVSSISGDTTLAKMIAYYFVPEENYTTCTLQYSSSARQVLYSTYSSSKIGASSTIYYTNSIVITEAGVYNFTGYMDGGDGVDSSAAMYKYKVDVRRNAYGRLYIADSSLYRVKNDAGEAVYEEVTDNAMTYNSVANENSETLLYNLYLGKTFTDEIGGTSIVDHDGEFQFTLTPSDEAAAATMPDGAESLTVTNNGSIIAFNGLYFTSTGDYTYTVKEEVPEGLSEGYDARVWTVTLNVSRDKYAPEKGLVVSVGAVSSEGDVPAVNRLATFNNVLKADPVEVNFTVNKTLEDSNAAAGAYDFTVSVANLSTATALDAGTIKRVDTITDDYVVATASSPELKRGVAAEVTSTTVSFSKTGTYVFDITEAKGDDSNITYDMHSARAVVTVTLVDGKLVADVAYENADFTNVAKTPVPDDLVVSVTKDRYDGDTRTYTYDLVDPDGNVVQTVTLAEDGTIAFDPIAAADVKIGDYKIVEYVDGVETGQTVKASVSENEDGSQYDVAYEPDHFAKTPYVVEQTFEVPGAVGAGSYTVTDPEGNIVDNTVADGDVTFKQTYTSDDIGTTEEIVVTDDLGNKVVVTVTVSDADNNGVPEVSYVLNPADGFTSFKTPASVTVETTAKKPASDENTYVYKLVAPDGTVVGEASADENGKVKFDLAAADSGDYKIVEYTVADGEETATGAEVPASVTVSASADDPRILEGFYELGAPYNFDVVAPAKVDVETTGVKPSSDTNTYSYDLVDADGNVVATVEPDENGAIVLPDVFDETGTYNLTIVENVVASDGTKTPTGATVPVTVTVEVSETDSQQLVGTYVLGEPGNFDVEEPVSVTQTIEVPGAEEGKDYEATGPEGQVDVTVEDGKVKFDVEYTAEDVSEDPYVYTVTDGENEVTVTVTVSDTDNDGVPEITYTIDPEDGFNNFKKTEEPVRTTVTIPGADDGNDYVYVVTDEDGNIIAVVTPDENGDVVFDLIHTSEDEGENVYVVTEKTIDEDGKQVDTGYTVDVTASVTVEDGETKVDVTFEPETGFKRPAVDEPASATQTVEVPGAEEGKDYEATGPEGPVDVTVEDGKVKFDVEYTAEDAGEEPYKYVVTDGENEVTVTVTVTENEDGTVTIDYTIDPEDGFDHFKKDDGEATVDPGDAMDPAEPDDGTGSEGPTDPIVTEDSKTFTITVPGHADADHEYVVTDEDGNVIPSENVEGNPTFDVTYTPEDAGEHVYQVRDEDGNTVTVTVTVTVDADGNIEISVAVDPADGFASLGKDEGDGTDTPVDPGDTTGSEVTPEPDNPTTPVEPSVVDKSETVTISVPGARDESTYVVTDPSGSSLESRKENGEVKFDLTFTADDAGTYVYKVTDDDGNTVTVTVVVTVDDDGTIHVDATIDPAAGFEGMYDQTVPMPDDPIDEGDSMVDVPGTDGSGDDAAKPGDTTDPDDTAKPGDATDSDQSKTDDASKTAGKPVTKDDAASKTDGTVKVAPATTAKTVAKAASPATGDATSLAAMAGTALAGLGFVAAALRRRK